MRRQVVQQGVVQTIQFNPGRANMFAVAMNSTQGAFYFRTGPSVDERSIPSHRLSDGTYDLDSWIRAEIGHLDERRPLIIVTDLAYGEIDHIGDPDNRYFSDLNVEIDGVPQDVCIISTAPWTPSDGLPAELDYLILMASVWVLGRTSGPGEIELHDDVRGCLFDYCDRTEDLAALVNTRHLDRAPFCPQCWQKIEKNLGHHYDVEMVSSALRLFWRATHQRCCFVAIPFNGRYDAHFECIRASLGSRGWKVYRADTFEYIRDIGIRMKLLIMSADLVIGDITDANPNVLFELGLAEGIEIQTQITSGKKRLPFDLGFRHTIFYKDLDDFCRRFEDSADLL